MDTYKKNSRSSDSFKITGRIYESESGAGIPNLCVKAFNKSIYCEYDLLGKTTTSSDGQFEITYSEDDFKTIFEKIKKKF